MLRAIKEITPADIIIWLMEVEPSISNFQTLKKNLKQAVILFFSVSYNNYYKMC